MPSKQQAFSGRSLTESLAALSAAHAHTHEAFVGGIRIVQEALVHASQPAAAFGEGFYQPRLAFEGSGLEAQASEQQVITKRPPIEGAGVLVQGVPVLRHRKVEKHPDTARAPSDALAASRVGSQENDYTQEEQKAGLVLALQAQQDIDASLRRLTRGFVNLEQAMKESIAGIRALLGGFHVLMGQARAWQGLSQSQLGVTQDLVLAQQALNVAIQQSPIDSLVRLGLVGIALWRGWAEAAKSARGAQEGLNKARLHKDLGETRNSLLGISPEEASTGAQETLTRLGSGLSAPPVSITQIPLAATLPAAVIAPSSTALRTRGLFLPPLQAQEQQVFEHPFLGTSAYRAVVSNPFSVASAQASSYPPMLSEASALVRGGERSYTVQLHIGQALHVESLNNYTGEGMEEVQEKVLEAILRAIHEGAPSSSMARSHG